MKCALEGCNQPVPEARQKRHSKFCSRACTLADSRVKWRCNNAPLDIPRGTTGTVSELLVCVDLLKRGYEVFRSMSPACSCDLAALKDHVLCRIEVKTGFRSATKKNIHYSMNSKQVGQHDVLAIVLVGENIIEYRPTLEEWFASR